MPSVEWWSGSSTFTVAVGRSGRVAGKYAPTSRPYHVPVVLGVGRGMDAGVAAARADVALERSLLAGVERVAGRRQEDDASYCDRTRVGEQRRVLGRVDLEVVRVAERLDGGDALVDRVVAEAGRLGEHQHPEARLRVVGAEHRDLHGLRRRLLAVGDRDLGVYVPAVVGVRRVLLGRRRLPSPKSQL